MKSFCIKINNARIKNYLLKNLECVELEDVYYICRQFKIYENVIVHYVGLNEEKFIEAVSSLISNCILTNYEPILIKESLCFNYFYFDEFERKQIEDICYSYIASDEDETIKFRRNEIYHKVLDYVTKNKFMILDGFVNFRLKKYSNTIDDMVDYSVNKYIIEKEYSEFIDLLKLYVDSRNSNAKQVHLIYSNGESVLLDEKRNTILIDDNIFNHQYLSDISFSSNDYALNTLLTILPKKIDIHIIGYEDEFINTLKLIFD